MAGTPVKSWSTTRDGMNGISASAGTPGRHDASMRTANSYDEFKQLIEQPGFIWAHWDGTRETEDKIQEETKATIRCIPFDGSQEPGACMVTGQPSAKRVVA